MNTFDAIAMGEANRGKPLMVFDWDKAAQLIIGSNTKNASAGLRNDWEYTGGEIYKDGHILNRDESYTYLASTWAIPEINFNGYLISCFIMQDEAEKRWGKIEFSSLFWPQSAIDILNKNI